MGLRSSAAVIIFILLAFSGCGKSNYVSKSQTPDDLDGFSGFRWSTPMNVVDDEILQLTNAEPVCRLNDSFTSSYSNYIFMGRMSRLCQFMFDSKGLHSTKLTFKTSYSSAISEMNYFRNKLAGVYGMPVHMTRPPFQKEYLNYIDGYYWFNGRLVLTIMPGPQIILYACRDERRAPDAPPLPLGAG